MVAKGKKRLGSPLEHVQCMFSNISTLHNKDKFVDVVFHCYGGKVAAHKTMLAPLSVLLKDLFGVSFTMQASDITIISLADVDVKIVMKLMAYIYTGQLNTTTIKEKSEIKEIASLLDLKIDIPPETKSKDGQISTVSPEHTGDALTSDTTSPPSRNVAKKGSKSKISASTSSIPTNDASPLSTKPTPKRLGGFRSFDNEEIQEAIMENAKSRAELDKMKVGLKNVNKESDQRIKQQVELATSKESKENEENDNTMKESKLEKLILSAESKGKSPKRGKGSAKYEVHVATDERDYEVEEILDKQESLGNIQYLVKWKGWDDIDDRTWEPLSNLGGSEKLITAFEKMRQTDLLPAAPKKKSGKEVKIFDESIDDDYEVEKILDKKGKGKNIQYLVKWKNFDKPEDLSWEPLENLTESSEAIEAFENKSKTVEPGNKNADVPTIRNIKKTAPTKNKVSLFESETEDLAVQEDLIDDDYEVEKLLDKRGKGRNTEYLVKWKGFEKEEDQTWEPLENLTESREIIDAFEAKLQKKDQSKLGKKKQKSKHSIEIIENMEPVELEVEYEVEKIVDVREGDCGRKEYLVKWKGWEREQDRTWEPEESLSGSIKLLKEFEKTTKIVTPASGNSDIDEYEVETIIDVRHGADGKEYLVKWKGWEKEEDRTWEPVDSLSGSKQLLKEFEKQQKLKEQKRKSNEAQDDDEYEVEMIVDMRLTNGVKEYLVKWKGWENIQDRTWEPEESLSGSKKLVMDFEKEIGNKSKPEKSSKPSKRKSDFYMENPKKQSLNKSAKTSKQKREETSKKDKKLVEEMEETEYEVEKIVDHQELDGEIQYLVKWKNWSSDDNTWEPKENLVGSELIIAKYEKEVEAVKKIDNKDQDYDSSLNSKMKSDQNNEKDGNTDNEYEVEKIIDKRIVGGEVQYLVKWKGWEDEDDRTWEPEGNLSGSEKLIKKFEESKSNANKQKSSENKEKKTPKKQTAIRKSSPDDGVVLCVSCNRIFLSVDALRKHEKEEHNKAPVTPRIRKPSHDELSDHLEENSLKRKRNSIPDQTFHKSAQESNGSKTNSSNSSPLSSTIKTGPHSKKQKRTPFSDETLSNDEFSSPPSSPVRSPKWSPDKVGDWKRASKKKLVDLTDSSDDDDAVPPEQHSKTFDDLFSESKKINANTSDIVFNKDSDDESDDEKGHVDIDELMGGSDDDKSKNGDPVRWDLENI